MDTKTSDGQYLTYNDYVPEDLNIGGADHISMTVCLDCGKIQGEFPIDEETVLGRFFRQ